MDWKDVYSDRVFEETMKEFKERMEKIKKAKKEAIKRDSARGSSVWIAKDEHFAVRKKEDDDDATELKIIMDEYKRAKTVEEKEKIKKMIIERFGFNIE